MISTARGVRAPVADGSGLNPMTSILSVFRASAYEQEKCIEGCGDMGHTLRYKIPLTTFGGISLRMLFRGRAKSVRYVALTV